MIYLFPTGNTVFLQKIIKYNIQETNYSSNTNNINVNTNWGCSHKRAYLTNSDFEKLVIENWHIMHLKYKCYYYMTFLESHLFVPYVWLNKKSFTLWNNASTLMYITFCIHVLYILHKFLLILHKQPLNLADTNRINK